MDAGVEDRTSLVALIAPSPLGCADRREQTHTGNSGEASHSSKLVGKCQVPLYCERAWES